MTARSRGRYGLPGLDSPHPLLGLLPSIYAEDPVAPRLTGAFDEVLAPVFLALDAFPAHLDPGTAPPDFLAFLGRWVAALDDAAVPEDRRRGLVASAVELHRWRGTVRGLTRTLALVCGEEPDVDDPGGAVGATEPGTSPPGRDGTEVMVRLRSLGGVDEHAVRRVVDALRPAHVPVRLELPESPPGASVEGRTP